MPKTISLNTEALTQACSEVRGLAIDAVAAAASGHLGLPLGATEIGAVLFGATLRFHPEAPDWINRDRFVLSAGHGSLFLYAWLHLAGYELSLEEVKRFRQLHSKTPGHPEFGETVGVEATTGPLGQGTGNAVGMAVSSKMAAAHFNTPEHSILDHHIVVLAGDGCLQEGISTEAASFAGRFGLDNLIMFYDSNDVTLDAMAEKTQDEDTALRYESYGWDVVTLRDGHDLGAIFEAYERARAADNGRPKLIVCKTEIGRGIPEVAGTPKAHGEGGVKFAQEARKSLGLPADLFFVSEATRAYFAARKTTLMADYVAWQATYAAWKVTNPKRATLLEKGFAGSHASAEVLLKSIAHFDPDKALATRAAGGEALNAIAKEVPLLLSGSADLHGSTKNYLKEAGDFDKENPSGRNLHFGIREHAMGAIMNGIAYYGLFKVSGATFLTFSDYMRPAVRLAALAQLPVTYIWTHDSIGVGEDGPTHQPVETVTALRAIPNLEVFRPGDAEETAAAFAAAIERLDGPTALILSRQALPNLKTISVDDRRQGTLKGGYIAHRESGELEVIILATGSELSLALEAAGELGSGVRVVSLPCWERFESQPQAYRDAILPPSCTRRCSIEAGVTLAWARFVGFQGQSIGIDRFGLSAPAPQIFQELGLTKEALVNAVRALYTPLK